ncbi:MipA/OmpV family protein [Bacteriovoracaceae bacterium]|nr:MipA/OmpV family protein [Bacteriovoracaceae bacterium]
MQNKLIKSMIILFVFSLSLNIAAAGEFRVGFGYIQPGEYRVDNEINPLPLGMSFVPLIAYRGERLSVLGPNINYSLLKGPISFGIRLNAAGDRYKSHDLEERDSAINAGVVLRFYFLTLSHAADVSGLYNGEVEQLTVGWRLMLSDSLSFMPSIGKEFLSLEYTNYYYGVKEGESAYYPAYQTNNSVNDIYSARLIYKMSEDHSFSLSFKHRAFDKVIYDSPTINKQKFSRWAMFWSYKL